MIGILCIFRKYPYPPQRRLLKILKGRGVSKTKIFKRNYEAKLEFLEVWEGCNQKTFRGRGRNIVWNNTSMIKIFILGTEIDSLCLTKWFY